MYDHHSLRAAGRTGERIVEVAGEEMERLPEGASLVLIPGGAPVGLTRTGRFTLLEHNPWSDGRVFAVAALLPQGYTRTLLPSYIRGKDEKPLPLLGYTAVACRDGELYVAAKRTDDPRRWDPARYDSEDLPALIKERLEMHPENRILRQLARCSLDYRCFTAQNIFYGRWEGGIPVSPSCNARCLGCISLQPAQCCPSPQSRIDFKPTPREVAEVAVSHLKNGNGAMVSFGQGCEGEPALACGTVVEAIGRVRAATDLGTINMNSNGGYTAGVTEICRAGLDAVRISLISAREETYRAYCRPSAFSLTDIRRSIEAAVAYGVYTSLNLLVFPGLTDREGEVDALLELVRETGINLVQLRNLNIDPDLLFQHLPGTGENIIGIPALIKALNEVPGLAVGSFSRPVRPGERKARRLPGK
ncbi:MAG TPA: radical SAM protein [Bacillota bacterium]|nr:radical SAM protein [Bacillota bacterium]